MSHVTYHITLLYMIFFLLSFTSILQSGQMLCFREGVTVPAHCPEEALVPQLLTGLDYCEQQQQQN